MDRNTTDPIHKSVDDDDAVTAASTDVTISPIFEGTIPSVSRRPSLSSAHLSRTTGMKDRLPDASKSPEEGLINELSTELEKLPCKEELTDLIEKLQIANKELIATNERIATEVDFLKNENETLKKELEETKTQYTELVVKVEEIEAENHKLCEDLAAEKKLMSELHKDHELFRDRMLKENLQKTKQLETLRKQADDLESQLQERLQETANMKQKLDIEKHSRERRLELLHELEVTRQEKLFALGERDDGLRLQKSLSTELDSLKEQFDLQSSELRNEHWRHSVLTKEFNSLLNENSRLKLQLGRRMSNGRLLGRDWSASPARAQPVTQRRLIQTSSTTSSLPSIQNTPSSL